MPGFSLYCIFAVGLMARFNAVVSHHLFARQVPYSVCVFFSRCCFLFATGMADSIVCGRGHFFFPPASSGYICSCRVLYLILYSSHCRRRIRMADRITERKKTFTHKLQLLAFSKKNKKKKKTALSMLCCVFITDS